MSTKVELTLPDWCDDKHIRVFAGIELVAKKMLGESWKIKTVRCNKCGECCKTVNFGDDGPGNDPDTGWCNNLIYYANEFLCKADRPFTCSAGSPVEKDFCCIEFKTVEGL